MMLSEEAFVSRRNDSLDQVLVLFLIASLVPC